MKTSASKKQKKVYVIRKFIKATSALSAIRQDKTTPVHEVFLDEKWRDTSMPPADAIGFQVPDAGE